MNTISDAQQTPKIDHNDRLPKTRWGAFAGHFLISLAIFLALCAVIYLLLFPGALFTVAGGIDGIKIVAGVDLVLGPLLTLVIYNYAKPRKELIRDLAIIAFIQFSALAAGMYVVYQNRPAVVTYVLDTFHALKISQFARNGQTAPQNINLLTPAFYVLKLPADQTEATTAVLTMEMAGESPASNTRLYEPLSESLDIIKDQLRVDRNTYLEGDCIAREVSTAYDITTLCFDLSGRRFTRSNAGTAAASD